MVRSRKPRLTAVGIRCADHVTPSTRKIRHYFADSGGRSVGVVRLRTKTTEFSFSFSTVMVKEDLEILMDFMFSAPGIWENAFWNAVCMSVSTANA
jgi:hypothetical protein